MHGEPQQEETPQEWAGVDDGDGVDEHAPHHQDPDDSDAHHEGYDDV